MRSLTLLPALLAVTCVVGVFRPWAVPANPGTEGWGTLLGVIGWVAFPSLLAAGAFFASQRPAWRTTVGAYLLLLGIFWGFGSAVTLLDAGFDGNLGLLFWPFLQMVGLVVTALVGAAVSRTADKQGSSTLSDGGPPARR